MCTLSWFVNSNGYELFFNRDERRSRRRAQLPSLQSSGGVQYLSPTDADAGGTWIATNQFGVTVCLLNHYQFEQLETYKLWVSRGEMVRNFATTNNLKHAKKQFFDLNLNDYRAFRMFIITPNGANALFVWDGHLPRIECDVMSPKSSSSVDAKQVKSLRKQLFTDMNLVESQQVDEFIEYHSSHDAGRSKESVCMHRSDANTVSLSHVSVSADAVNFRYADGSPCEAAFGDKLTLNIAAPALKITAPISGLN